MSKPPVRVLTRAEAWALFFRAAAEAIRPEQRSPDALAKPVK